MNKHSFALDTDVAIRPCIRLYGHLVHFVIRLKSDRQTEVEYDTDDWISPGLAHWYLSPLISDLASRFSRKGEIRRMTAALLVELTQELDVMWQSGILYDCPITGRLGIKLPKDNATAHTSPSIDLCMGFQGI